MALVAVMVALVVTINILMGKWQFAARGRLWGVAAEIAGVFGPRTFLRVLVKADRRNLFASALLRCGPFFIRLLGPYFSGLCAGRGAGERVDNLEIYCIHFKSLDLFWRPILRYQAISLSTPNNSPKVRGVSVGGDTKILALR